ncbi:two-component system, sensor histidine kinase YesM [Paenibacillus algorifonticola]|uniref:Two-component system, sensor histidine kinase YesM n=1 Tax=Paenibacillus algorifonticola TaxID=684063 RepID=A0A1I1YPL0_9BACL|nr:sensor histidine kinase [Paenibacillus algorifonticola]SFE21242.1 two-component system, sensor histidine kinase YesM [Paenibacillus algorifonticola]
MKKQPLIVRKMNDVRIKHKLMISFLLVVCIPVLLVGIILTAAFRQNVLNQATQQTLNNVEKIKKQTDDIIRMPITISDKMLFDNALRSTVNTNYESTYEAVSALWEFRAFKDYMQLYSEINNIRFYTTNQTILDNWEFIKTSKATEEASWYQSAMGEDGIHWMYMKDETKKNNNYLSLVRKIPFPTYRTSGVLVIGINQGKLNALLSQEPFDTMIFDDSGYIVAASNPKQVGLNLTNLDFSSQLSGKGPGTFEILYEGKRSRLVMEELTPQSSRNGLRIVSVFSIDSIVSEANRISILGLTIMGISLAIAFLLIYFFSGLLATRMLLLNKNLNKVAMGDLTTVATVDGNDEIGLLSRQFNNMVVSIRGLMDEVSESQRQQDQLELRQKDIKLKMMASQINPHFLFNALESIRMKAHVNGETEISSIVHMLGKLIRRNLEIGAGKIRLKDELEIVRCYLEIQKFRYGNDRLTFNLELDPNAQSLEIPPLIIQPLIENAVIHGLENIDEGGCVTVTTLLQDRVLHVQVSDNGIGIGEARMDEIMLALGDMDDEQEYRIGLRNVHQRLVLLYGQASGLEIKSGGEDGGTTITFQIPQAQGGQEDA